MRMETLISSFYLIIELLLKFILRRSFIRLLRVLTDFNLVPINQKIIIALSNL